MVQAKWCFIRSLRDSLKKHISQNERKGVTMIVADSEKDRDSRLGWNENTVELTPFWYYISTSLKKNTLTIKLMFFGCMLKLKGLDVGKAPL